MQHAIYLASTNELVEIHNNKMLNDHPGEIWYSKAIDSGSSRVLNGITLCRSTLRLKIGVPVIITKNSDQTVYNGLRGTVCELDSKKMYVKVQLADKSVVVVRREVFSRMYQNKVYTRNQFPLRLAFGLTIHRCQGQTLDAIIVDCSNLFLPNQLGVAISRVQKVEHVSLVNLDLSSLQRVMPALKAFMETGVAPIQVMEDVCCRHVTIFGCLFV